MLTSATGRSSHANSALFLKKCGISSWPSATSSLSVTPPSREVNSVYGEMESLSDSGIMTYLSR